MKILDEILDILKNNPVLIEELKKASQLPDDKFYAVTDFLESLNLIEISNDGKVSITASGLRFLDLPVEGLSRLDGSE